MEDRNCNECVYSTRDGFCRKFECAGTVTVEDIKAEAIEEFGNWIFENGYDSSSHNIKAWITEYNLRDKVSEQLKKGENNGKTRFNG